MMGSPRGFGQAKIIFHMGCPEKNAFRGRGVSVNKLWESCILLFFKWKRVLFGVWYEECLEISVIESMFQTDNYVLGQKLLDVSHIRHKLLSGNLANLETPGYKRMDIDPSFEAQLVQSVFADDFDRVRESQVRVASDETAAAVRPDGNNVSLNNELMEINENAMQYEFLTQYVSDNIKSLNKAIRGRL